MNNSELDSLLTRWRQGETDSWSGLKPVLAHALRQSKPALDFPPEHLEAIRRLLCLRLEMASEDEMRRVPGERFWEFFASLSRRFLIELLREGASRGRPVPRPVPGAPAV